MEWIRYHFAATDLYLKPQIPTQNKVLKRIAYADLQRKHFENKYISLFSFLGIPLKMCKKEENSDRHHLEDTCTVLCFINYFTAIYQLLMSIKNIVTCCRKPEYWNEDIRPSLVNGFAKHVPAAMEKSVTCQRLVRIDVFQQVTNRW
jgi:hypothetical protein